MLVSSPPISEESRSAGALRLGVRTLDDAIDSAGEALPVSVGVADCARFAAGRSGGGRIDAMFLFASPACLTGAGAGIIRTELEKAVRIG